jgi:hypothetical protein
VATGFFLRGKLEPLFAYAHSFNAKQPLVLAQAFWHGFMPQVFGRGRLDLFFGTALYLGSSQQTDESFLHAYADRDTFWARAIYYLL